MQLEADSAGGAFQRGAPPCILGKLSTKLISCSSHKSLDSILSSVNHLYIFRFLLPTRLTLLLFF